MNLRNEGAAGVVSEPQAEQAQLQGWKAWFLVLAALGVGFGVFLLKRDFAATCDAAFHLRYARDFFLAVLDGVGYPDWDAFPFDGRGTAAFRYYAPFPYLVAGVLQVLGFRVVNAVKVTMLVFASAAVLGVRAWFQTMQRESSWIAASVILLISPILAIHLFYVFLFQNLCAMCLFPWLLAGLTRFWRGESGGFQSACIPFALMLLTHLPSALIAGYVAGLLGLRESWKQRRAMPVARLALAVCVGMMLAAPYVLPSILTLSHIHFQRGMSALAPGTGTECLDDPFLTPTLRRMTALNALGRFAELVRQSCLKNVSISVSPATLDEPRLVVDNDLYPFTEVRPWLWFCLLTMLLAALPGSFRFLWRDDWWSGLIGLALVLLSLRAATPIFLALPGLHVLQFAWRLLLPAQVLILPWMTAGLVGERGRLSAALCCLPLLLLTLGLQMISGTFTPPMVEAFQLVPAYPWEYLPVACPEPERLSPRTGKPHRLTASPEITAIREMERGFEHLVFHADVASNGGMLTISTHHDPGWALFSEDLEIPLRSDGPCGVMRASLPAGSREYRLIRRRPPGRPAGWIAMLLGLGCLLPVRRPQSTSFRT